MTDTLALMDLFLGSASAEARERIAGVGRARMRALLGELGLPPQDLAELDVHWESTRDDPRWANLLAALSDRVRRDRGRVDAPMAIWSDLDEYGAGGRLLYYYLFALELEGLLDFYEALGVPDDVRRASVGALARHGETHRLKHASAGVDAGWWTLPLLWGNILEVGSLKFEYLHLGVGTLSPHPWLDEATALRWGEGFRAGDPAFNVHIPARIDLSDEALDATFARAREVLGTVWPVATRRIATCQSWMMDDRLISALGERSRVVRFQRRFELIEPYAEDVDNVLYFVFGVEGVDPSTLVATTRLQRCIKEVLLSGGSWHSRTGWMPFD